MMNLESLKIAAPSERAEPVNARLLDALKQVKEAIEFAPLGGRAIHALENARAAIVAAEAQTCAHGSDEIKAGSVRPTPEQIEKADEAIREALGSNAFDCVRVWSAWEHGTMRNGDFWLIAESDERVAEIRDAVLAALGIQPPEAGGGK